MTDEQTAPVTVLRLTRHSPEPAQLAALARIYGGDVRVVQVDETVPDVARIRTLITEHDADVLEAVLPVDLLAACMDPVTGVGVDMIRAVMGRTLLPGGEIRFRFVCYERFLEVRVRVEPL